MERLSNSDKTIRWNNGLQVFSSDIECPTTGHKLKIYRHFGPVEGHPSLDAYYRAHVPRGSIHKNSSDTFTHRDEQSNELYMLVHGAGGRGEQYSEVVRTWTQTQTTSQFPSHTQSPSQDQKDPESRRGKPLFYTYDWFGHHRSFENNEVWEEFTTEKMEQNLEFFIRYCFEEYIRFMIHGSVEHVLSSDDIFQSSALHTPLYLVGHSYGTCLLVRLLSRIPSVCPRLEEGSDAPILHPFDHVKGLLLISTTNVVPPSSRSFIWLLPVRMLECVRPIMSKANRNLMYKSASDEVIAYWASVASQNSLVMMRALLRQMQWYQLDDVKNLKKNHPECRVIFVSGEADRVTDPAGAKSLADASESIYCHLKDTSHNLIVEFPEKIIPLFHEKMES